MTTPIKPTVLVTGSARRIGRALALDFGRRGWQVAVHAHTSKADAAAAVDEIKASGGAAAAVIADLADHTAVKRMVDEVMQRFGPMTCLINNASLFLYDDVATLGEDLWDRHMAINLKAPVFLAKAMAENLPSGVAGNVINIIDQRVWKPTPHFFSYAASKAGLWAVTQTLAQALAPRIRVNAIGPGPALKSIHQAASDFEIQAKSTLLGRGTTPEEIAAAVRFILDAPAMTGQMIALDGGQHLAWATPDVGDGRG